MLALLLGALLAIILFGVSLTLHALWWAAVAVTLTWMIGFLVRSEVGHWYRW